MASNIIQTRSGVGYEFLDRQGLEALVSNMKIAFVDSDISVAEWRFNNMALNSSQRNVKVNTNSFSNILGNAFQVSSDGYSVEAFHNGPGLIIVSSSMYVISSNDTVNSNVQIDLRINGIKSVFSIGIYDFSFNNVAVGPIYNNSIIRLAAAKWSGSPTRTIDGNQSICQAVHIPVNTESFEAYFNTPNH